MTGEHGGGMVKARDFVSVRCWQRLGGHLVMALVAAEHPQQPPCKNILR